MKKIIKLAGGLGNQLFQFAYGRHCEALGCDVLFDISDYEEVSRYRDLGIYPLIEKQICSTEASSLKKNFGRIAALLNNYYSSNYYLYDYNHLVVGYFQNYKWIMSQAERLKDELNEYFDGFSVNREEGWDVVIHCRQGDYLSNPNVFKNYGVISDNYYYKVLEFLNDFGVSNVVVTSDSFIPATHPLATYPLIEEVLERSKVEAQAIVSFCRASKIFVGSNSTLSWWSSFLADDSRLEFFPRFWSRSFRFHGRGLYLPKWRLVEN